jgi:hypothetical protein
MLRDRIRAFLTGAAGALVLLGGTAHAQGLPTGYLVWSRGAEQDPSSRQIFRMTLPEMADRRALTAGEDVEPRISPDGKWIAYAKAKFPGGSDYHDFRLWRPYLVSIHGVGEGRAEIKIDDDGAWPSWSNTGALFYDQANGTHTQIVRVQLDEQGRVVSKQAWLSTQAQFPQFGELNECFVAPDETWFAGRTRGNTDQNGVGAFSAAPPAALLLARAGSIGCMPFVAPSGLFGIIAGAGQGIRWGHNPFVPGRLEDQLLVPPLSASHLAYHPGISTDEKWVLDAQSTDPDHNAGRYDLYLHTLDTATMTAGPAQALTADGFNGWPHLWVGTPGPPPPPQPVVNDFAASSYTTAPGVPVTLSWSTFGADLVTLDGAAVLSSGTLDVQPIVSTVYTLAAASSVVASSDTRTVTITVNPTPLPVSIDRFAATPPKVAKGGSTVLGWQVSNATTLELDGVPVPPVGAREVTPLETTTYLLSARGQADATSAQVTVVVEAMATGLLPDRGGFVCGVGQHGGGAAGALVGLGLALVGLVALRRRRRP